MGQSYFRVDVERPGQPTYTFGNIEDAVEGSGGWGGAAAGDKVILFGAVDSQGNPLAYSNASGTGPEYSGDQFPIDVPAGVTMTAAPGAPVYITASVGGTVLRILPGAGLKTLVEGVGIAGADIAIDATATAGQSTTLMLKDVSFGPNTVAVQADAPGGSVRCDVVDCTIGNPASLPTPPPAAKKFSVGLRFRAGASSTAGSVEGSVDSLTIAGPYPATDMAPAPFGVTSGPKHDLAAYANSFTRVIEVFTTELGDGVGEHAGTQPPFTTRPIPTATVTVSSVLDGKAVAGGSSNGWDVGIYASTSPDNSIPSFDFDYGNAFDLRVTGSVLKNFRAAGVYAETFVCSRGRVKFSGQSGVLKTGIQEAPGSGNSFLRSGVHAVNQEGYLAITGQDSAFKNNHGNGVYVYDFISMRQETYFPAGLFLGLESCQVFGNGMHGVSLDAARTKSHMGSPSQGATVGGTQDHYDPAAAPLHGPLSLIRSGDEPVPQDWDYGQGFINSCAISDNGGAGVGAFIVGSTGGLPGSITGFNASIASCRIENSFIWDNASGGFVADLLPWPGESYGPAFFMPIVHSTLVANEGSTGSAFNTDIRPGMPAGYWYSGDPSGHAVQTELFNSIFQRSIPTALDWGPGLEAIVESDLGTGPSSHLRLGVAGVRASWSLSLPIDPLLTISLNALATGGPFTAPFAGGVFPIGNPDHLFLTSGGHPKFYLGPNYFTVFTALADCAVDYLGTVRATLTNRDKGAFELP